MISTNYISQHKYYQPSQNSNSIWKQKLLIMDYQNYNKSTKFVSTC
jgi:hypothetical protein